MAAPGLERFYQHKAGRPPIVSQHSNSVPSTPHQHPRDLRFPSRSPSPGRGLNSHSPQSVVSEVPGAQVAQRAGPSFCRFESGAEFRKRRILYKDGGNDPLPPPSKVPKKSLEPHEDDKLSGDMRELYDRLLPSQESEERRALLIRKLEDILNKEWPGSDIRVNVFGSSGNLLSSSDSDVDVCITTPLKKLESMHGLATVLHQHGMEKVVCRASAKVPIVKFWDPSLQLACDMNVNNPLALENTRMIKTYVQADERVRPLAKIVKYWTKRRILNDAAFGGTISSYTWICMILNFLQTRKPRVLPSLQRLPESQRSVVNEQRSQFADDLNQIRGCGKDNKDSLGQLLFHFFRYYGYEVDYAKSVVSVKEGRLLSRKEKGWDPSNYQEKEARSRLCVEEPFNTNRNLGNSADDYAFSGIHEEIRRAFDLISQGKLDECCEQYEFPPEEKTIFQRPAPRPKPILTRSASQSGRPHANSVSAKSSNGGSRNSRNTSNHRSNSRRASSGAAFGHQQRYAYLQSPTVALNAADHFGVNGLSNGMSNGISTDQLHEQLYKQYQFLQAQQEALRNQLLQQQQNQAQAQMHGQGHGQPPATLQFGQTPRQRHFANSLPSPRVLESPPNTAPLLPGYLYHYPARYPPPSPLAQTRSQESASTNPSSPTVSNNMRRGGNRGSVPDMGSTPSTRSQSQPGRAFPNPVTLQSLAHPGYDVSGAIGTQFLMPRTTPALVSSQQQNGSDIPSIATLGNGMMTPGDTAMPKEYVGYYMGQSPQFGPHYPTGNVPYAPILRDAPHGSRRLSPEHLPPILPNGMRRQSRSPSPLNHQRNSSTSSNVRSAPLPQMPFPEAPPQLHPSSDNGPVIVNGSTSVSMPPIVAPHYDSLVHAVHGLGLGTVGGSSPIASQTMTPEKSQSNGTAQRANGINMEPVIAYMPVQKLQNTQHPANGVPADEQQALHDDQDVALRISPNLRARPPPPLNLSPNGEAQRDSTRPSSEQVIDVSPLTSASVLSPVAEMRTPSPTSSKWASSPVKNIADIVRSAQILNGSLNEARPIIAVGTAKPEPSLSRQSTEATGQFAAPAMEASVEHGNAWQQATRKGHKKSKSTTGSRSLNGVKNGGEPMPVNEADRKGG